PCLSIFRPVYPCAVGLPPILNEGGAIYDPASPWWVFERMQRIVAVAPALAPIARARLHALEAEFRAEADDAEAEAERSLVRGDHARAVAILRALVDSTTERAVLLAHMLGDELAVQTGGMTNPAMTEVWHPLNDTVGLPTITGVPACR
ncbi:MAG: hypothetical protein M3008_07560, partial [Chloroflexota bacterium]|nr:hypothetical protein [Chloroflexota bacterium]